MTEALKQNIEMVKGAVVDFLEEEPNLLTLGAHEQSLSHRIAVYLERRINNSDLHVDCEYNKNLGEPKLLEIDGLDSAQRRLCGCHVCANLADEIERERAFRPDIIVHRRHSNEYNTIAIEIKRGKFCPFDEAKLKALTGKRLDYNYALGVFVYFISSQPQFRWYTEGGALQV